MRRYTDEAGRTFVDYGLGFAETPLGQTRSQRIRCELPANGETAGYTNCNYSNLEQADACCHAAIGPHTQACRRSTL